MVLLNVYLIDFKQLYNIHAYLKWQMHPCAFALLTGKYTNDYKTLISHLKGGALNYRLVLQPKHLMIDFELVSKNAFEYHFPNIQVRGCFFHVSQSLIKKIHNSGLKTAYNDNLNGLRSWVKKMIALALVPIDKVDGCFCELMDLQPELDDAKKVTKFCDYVCETYIESEHFPKVLWNHYDNDGKRSNNDLEGFLSAS